MIVPQKVLYRDQRETWWAAAHGTRPDTARVTCFLLQRRLKPLERVSGQDWRGESAFLSRFWGLQNIVYNMV